MSNIIDPNLVVQEITFNPDDLKINSPSTMCISGPSMCGKTTFILNLIKHRNEMFKATFSRIIYCQPHTLQQPTTFEKIKAMFPNAEHCFGLPNFAALNLSFNILPVLIVLDDLMHEIVQSPEFVKIVTQDVHHRNLTVIFTLQNYYVPTGRSVGKTITKNCQYRVFFFNMLEQRETSTISSALCDSAQFMGSAFKYLASKFPQESNYLLIDGRFRSSCPDFFCRSCIFPNEKNELSPIIFFKNPHYSKKK